MSTYFEDFSSFTIGTQPTGWTKLKDDGVATWTVESDGAGGKLLRGVNSQAGISTFTKDSIDSDPNKANIETVCKFRISDNNGNGGLVDRGVINFNVGYLARLFNPTPKRFRLAIGGVNLGQNDYLWSTNTWYRARLRCNSNNIQAKIWLDSESEPGSWSPTATNSDLSTGGAGVFNESTFGNIEFDWVGFGTNGDTAPTSSGTQNITNSTITSTATLYSHSVSSYVQTLDDLLFNPELSVNIAVELYSANRVTGTLKTWYFARFVDQSLSTSEPTFNPYLDSVGTLTQSLAEDKLFHGLAESNPGNVNIVQRNPNIDRLSQLLDYTFGGYKCVIKLGELGRPYTSYFTYRTLVIEKDPNFTLLDGSDGGYQLTFNLMSVLGRLKKETVQVQRNVGIPTCIRILTASGGASAPYISAYNLSSFTLAARYKIPSNPTGLMPFFLKQISSSSRNFYLYMNSIGWIEARASISGTDNLLLSSSASKIGVNYRYVLWSLLDKTYSYLMVDNEIVDEESTLLTSSVDLQVVDITMLTGFSVNNFCDFRIIPYYMTPDEAIIEMSARSNGNMYAGLFNFDDGGSANTARDYSPNNNTATLLGTLNIDYSWQPSYLGEKELSGTLMPLTVGTPFNIKAQLVDKERQIYRINDKDATSGLQNESIKSRGTLLVETTDYTDQNNGTYKMVSQEDEPITVDLIGTGDEDRSYITRIIPNTLSDRTRMSNSDMDLLQLLALEFLVPWQSGYYTTNNLDVQQLLEFLVGESGLHYLEDELGRLFFNLLLPPIGLGPYGEPCIDYRGTGYIEMGNIGNVSGNYTLAGWFYTHATDISLIAGTYPPISQYLFGNGTNYRLGLVLEGIHAGKIILTNGENADDINHNIKSASGLYQQGGWYFLATTFHSSIGRRMYLAPLGSLTLNEIASGNSVGPGGINIYPLRFGNDVSTNGYFWGSSCYSQVWNGVAKTKTELEAIMLTPPIGNELNLSVYVPATEGFGSVYNVVTGIPGTIHGAASWIPKLTINLTETPSIRLSDIHYNVPAWKILVKYARNWNKMSDGDIDTGVSQSTRLGLTNEWQEVHYENETIREIFKQASTIDLDSPLIDKEDSQRLARYLLYKLGTDRMTITLDFPPGQPISRRILGLKLGDEVRVISSTPSKLAAGRMMRVVSRAVNLLELSGRLVLWG